MTSQKASFESPSGRNFAIYEYGYFCAYSSEAIQCVAKRNMPCQAKNPTFGGYLPHPLGGDTSRPYPFCLSWAGKLRLQSRQRIRYSNRLSSNSMYSGHEISTSEA